MCKHDPPASRRTACTGAAAPGNRGGHGGCLKRPAQPVDVTQLLQLVAQAPR